MTLEKITEKVGRRYHDACGAAHGLDLIGERWALLVIRELMMGPRRFGDLRKDLHGISANVLTQRLEGLEASGILRRRKLPPPASVQVYELTDWGYEIKPVFMVLGRWAARSPLHDPTLPISAVSIMQSFETMFDPVLAGEAVQTLGFVFGDEPFVVRVESGAITTRRDATDAAEVVISTQPPLVAACVYGKVAPAVFEGDGLMTLTGDRAVFERFVSFFNLPEKAGA
ncbi:helix-turn-helix domain-containing protein [Brevundimonas sp.]|uniref:winged helix-turn-helix transcriptional regulator n=1 Tax=Brevundimonas sp. TaxID=1871086 RepID=UPI00289AA44D|nr:helix-turn-helix domain-containing protein [Brevundimonas sp.]